jgi:hypothetical protein
MMSSKAADELPLYLYLPHACRSVSSSSDVLQLSHSGLRPQQLNKVAMALAAAPWIRRLDLSGALQQLRLITIWCFAGDFSRATAAQCAVSVSNVWLSLFGVPCSLVVHPVKLYPMMRAFMLSAASNCCDHSLQRSRHPVPDMRCVGHAVLVGNLLTDASIADLAQLLLSSPTAASITHLDLSQNQMLTWRCCRALGQLLADNSTAQQQQQLTQGYALPVAPHCEPLAAEEPAEQEWQLSAATVKMSTLSFDSARQRTLSRTSSSSSETRDAAAAAVSTQIALPQQLQPQIPLMLRALSLEGVALGDKGAAALMAALTSNQHLQVGLQVLARCKSLFGFVQLYYQWFCM